MKKVGILRFLGTNCDRDVWQAVEEAGARPEWVWFADRFDTGRFDALILPGGFSYGDYLRSGALAARAPVMDSVRESVKRGTPVLGICNGFQILCEAGLLPGALLRNSGQRFKEGFTSVRLAKENSFWGGASERPLQLSIAHADGRYFAPAETLREIEDKGQVWLRYEKNPNGSLNDIAGVMSPDGKVAALMPHPERALFSWMGSTDGRQFFSTLTTSGSK